MASQGNIPLEFRVNGIYCLINELVSDEYPQWDTTVNKVFGIVKSYFHDNSERGRFSFDFERPGDYDKSTIKTIGFEFKEPSEIPSNAKEKVTQKYRQLTEKKNIKLDEGILSSCQNVLPLDNNPGNPNNHISYVWQYYLGVVTNKDSKNSPILRPRTLGQPPASETTLSSILQPLVTQFDLTNYKYRLVWRLATINGSCPSSADDTP